MPHFVIVGAGQAGASVAATLRANGYTGDITMIGGEPHPPYQRPPLSKGYLLGDLARERLFLKPERWYTEAGVDLRLDVEAGDLDPEARTICAGDTVLRYDELVLATGLAARPLPEPQGGGLGNVFTVRRLGDIDRMGPVLRQARRLLVVGGGYIGLEAAAVARSLGLEVTVIEAAPRILGRVAAPQTADYFRDLHRARGVDLREGVALDRLTGDGVVEGAILSDGSRIDADLAVVGIGLLPRCAIAEAAGIATEGGVIVDDLGRTSAPHVWAAGDCAALPYRGTRLRLESVQNAVDMGAAVARNMTGADQPYHPQPWFWSDQYDIHLQIAGLGTGYDRIVVRGEGASRSHWYYRGGDLLAVDAMNDARAYMVGKRLLAAGRSPAPEAVSNEDQDLKALMQA